MNYLDIASVVILMWATWTGLRRGLIRSLTSLAGWLLALILGTRFAPVLAPRFELLTQDPVVQKIAAFALIAAIVLFIAAIIGNILRKLLKALKLGLTEQAAGGIFGAAKGSLILMIAIQLLGPWVAESPYWQKSHMVALLSPYAPVAIEMSQHVAGQVWDEVKSSNGGEDAEAVDSDQYGHNVSRRDNHTTVPNPFS
ncbi:CvpA family protein [Alkanindiges sp. WGS2144]|uniref:CvpA family protein n=1 Tax=Alkanindiges sp. WGS2144 TaxID=3366808 RepID=UPI003750C14E